MASKKREPHEGALSELRRRMHSIKCPEETLGPDGFLATGLPALDRALGGGVAKGKVTELAGKGSCGRTALAVSLAAKVSRGLSDDSERKAEGLVAWLDTGDCLDVAGLQASAACMSHVLWLRGAGHQATKKALKAIDVLLDSKSFSLIVLDCIALAAHRLPRQSSWWMRITRKLQLSESALLVLTQEPVVFQPACRVTFSSKKPLSEPLLLSVTHRGCGEVHSFSPVQFRRALG